MTKFMKNRLIRNIFEEGNGILRLLPNFIPRNFSKPGFRLKLHPDDYYPFGVSRGAIKERWFCSTVKAQNGEYAQPSEGLSFVATNMDGGETIAFVDVVNELGEELIGPELFKEYGTWPMFAKFFDYDEPLFHHLHPNDEAAKHIGSKGKPEAYYYPAQLNSYKGKFPYTFFGLLSDVTKEEVLSKLLDFTTGDNKITTLSKAYRLETGTGWYTPPGVLHAPGSLLTYEPQWNSDVNAVFENITAGETNEYALLVQSCPTDKKNDLNYVLELLDWGKNIDPFYKQKYFRPPVLCRKEEDVYCETWITYGNPFIGAKELSIEPGKK